MRRGPGIAGLHKNVQAKKQYEVVADNIASLQTAQLQEQLKVFKDNLADFAQKYKKDIKKDPEFRMHFQVMCQKTGVDPLASNKGFWAELLGVGDFYYELAVQIIEVCLTTRAQNGGLIEISDLRQYLSKKRGPNAQQISEDDIQRAITKVKILGSGFDLLTVGAKKMIQSVPCELNIDHTAILVLAQEHGFITVSQIVKELNWNLGRIDTVLNLLLQEGMAWIDKQSSEIQYWFPSLIGGLL